MKACAGPGKTALLAWLGWNFLLTRPHPMIGATSVNAANLRAKLWTELARWYAAPRAGILRTTFTMTKTEIFANDHPQTWRLEARTWAQDANAEQIGNALAGLHAKYVMWLLDESGGYPDSIMPVCEAIFAGDPTHAYIPPMIRLAITPAAFEAIAATLALGGHRGICSRSYAKRKTTRIQTVTKTAQIAARKLRFPVMRR